MSNYVSRNRMRLVIGLLLCCVLGVVQAAAQSQASTGQIAGTVKDPGGAVVPGATIKVVNIATGFEQTATTGDTGLYRLVLLPAGKYKVTVQAQGFSVANAEAQVGVGRIADLNFQLAVGARKEEVTVTAEAVEVTRNENAAFVNSTIVANIPLNGRRFQDIATLTPSVQIDPQRGGIAMTGQRAINASVNIDGSDYSNPFFGGLRGGERSNQAPTVPLDAVEEFQMVRAGYTAEFGRSTGGIMTAITKSGTNAIHGSVGYNIRHQDLSKSNEFFDTAQTQLTPNCPTCQVHPAPTLQQWSGAIGGPIKKDKLFYFGSYTQQRNRIPRQVFFDKLLLSSTSRARGAEAFDFYQSLQVPYEQTNDAIALMAKADYQISNRHRLTLRYTHSSNEAKNGTSTGNQLFPTITSALSNNGTEKDSTHTGVAQLTSFFGSLANEARFEYTWEERPRLANAQAPTVSNTIGTFGTVSFLGQNIENDYRLQMSDSVTKQAGTHTLKIGGELNRLHAFQLFGFNQNGAFSFNTSTVNTVLDIMTVGGTVANRFDGFNCGSGGSAGACVSYRRQLGNLQAAMLGHQAALFLQDSWRVLPNFTLNYGLRWEGAFNPQPEANNGPMLAKVQGFTFPSGHVEDPATIRNQFNQFAPRLGFAWDPFKTGKTVVRGFGGIYYASTPLLLYAGPINNFRVPPGDLSISLPFRVPNANPNKSIYQQLKLIGINLNSFSLTNLPILTVDQVTSIATALGLSAPDPFFGAAPIMIDSRYHNPTSYQAGFGLERELAKGWTAAVEGTWVKSVYLERNRELNLPVPVTDAATGRPLYRVSTNVAQRPITTLDSIQARESSAKSLYRGLTFRTNLNKRWGQVNVYYTLSENLSDDDNERTAGGIVYENGFNLAPEYGFSNLDRKHMLVASPVFFLPHSIEVSSAMRFLSGAPIDASTGTDLNQDRVSSNDRPYWAPGVPFTRNSFRNTWQNSVDMRVQKGFRLSESKRIKVSAEFFNVFNWMNLAYSGSNVTNFCSGTATLTCGMSGATNPTFLKLRDPATGTLIQSNNPGPVFQTQLSARFEF